MEVAAVSPFKGLTRVGIICSEGYRIPYVGVKIYGGCAGIEGRLVRPLVVLGNAVSVFDAHVRGFFEIRAYAWGIGLREPGVYRPSLLDKLVYLAVVQV